MVYLKGKLYMKDLSSKEFLSVIDNGVLQADELDGGQVTVKLPKRNPDVNDWNDSIYEITDQSQLSEQMDGNEKSSYRTVKSTPIFSDGEYLYIIAQYVKMVEAEIIIDHFELESYSIEDWKNVHNVVLDLTPENLEGKIPEKESKILEESDMLKGFLSNTHSENKLVNACNGETLITSLNGKMFFFDLKTGKRYTDTLDIPNTSGGYDYQTNTFWFYDENNYKPVLKSFKVDGFKSKVELANSDTKSISEIIKQRTSEVLESQRSEHKAPPRNLESFLKKLGNKPKECLVVETKENESMHQSLYLIMFTINKG